jgi:hypothetical protein
LTDAREIIDDLEDEDLSRKSTVVVEVNQAAPAPRSLPPKSRFADCVVPIVAAAAGAATGVILTWWLHKPPAAPSSPPATPSALLQPAPSGLPGGQAATK